MRVVRSNQDTDCERTKDVEEQDTPEDSTNGLGDVLTGILGFTSSDSYKFYATI